MSCRSCHDPQHAYADPHPRSVGIEGHVGTRNAPSLVGIADDASFFWDGRRTQLEEAVLDPFTNPVEFGLPSLDALLDRLRREPGMIAKFRAAFPQAKDALAIEQVQQSLVEFIRSLKSGASAFDQSVKQGAPLEPQAEQGRRLFEGPAGCSECHAIDGKPARFSDGQFHHSGIEQTATASRFPLLAQAVVQQNLAVDALGPRVLSDADWSALGRFVVSHKPAEIGAFRTPSLRNVAITAPYMHDGSIATLSGAVDHEIYYRGFSSGHPINLTQSERQAIAVFLESLTDVSYRSVPITH